MYEPDYIIVQDSTLIKDVNVFLGVKPGGIVIVNTEKTPDYQVPDGVKLITIDATSIALKALGLPITNTSLMGAFAAATGEIQFSALEHALNHRFPKRAGGKEHRGGTAGLQRRQGGPIMALAVGCRARPGKGEGQQDRVVAGVQTDLRSRKMLEMRDVPDPLSRGLHQRGQGWVLHSGLYVTAKGAGSAPQSARRKRSR